MVQATCDDSDRGTGGIVSSTVDHQDTTNEDVNRRKFVVTRIKTEEYSPQSGVFMLWFLFSFLFILLFCFVNFFLVFFSTFTGFAQFIVVDVFRLTNKHESISTLKYKNKEKVCVCVCVVRKECYIFLYL